jgi:hypothetical protein
MQHRRYAIFQLNPNLTRKNSNLMVPAFFDLTSCWRRQPISSVQNADLKLRRHVLAT